MTSEREPTLPELLEALDVAATILTQHGYPSFAADVRRAITLASRASVGEDAEAVERAARALFWSDFEGDWDEDVIEQHWQDASDEERHIPEARAVVAALTQAVEGATAKP